MLTVMSFNILDGAVGYGPSTGSGRWEAIVDIVSQERPDVLVLCECNGFDSDGSARLYQMEQRTGLRGNLALAATGYHVGIFARNARWIYAKPLLGFYHAALRVKLEIAGEPLTVVGAHLCPFSAQLRLGEAEILAYDAKPDERVLLMGDLNALSPLDDTGEALNAMSPQRRARHRGTSGQADTRALEALMAAGFVDLADRLGTREYTYPTALREELSKPRVRIDYALATAPLAERATQFSVIRGPTAERASDHYAVVAKIA
jgi:endonuclease/exonuclease/phosphatase family metal-dependent hydrolase